MKEYFIKYSINEAYDCAHLINYDVIAASSREEAITKLISKAGKENVQDILLCDTEENLWIRNRAKMWEIKATRF